MATGSIFSYSDIFSIYGVVESTHLSVIKQLIIAQLRSVYSQDSFYSYRENQWGFPEVVDETGLSPDAGMHDNLTTRVYISEFNPLVSAFYPSMIVKGGQIKYLPMSLNRERDTIRYSVALVYDGYGNSKEIHVPEALCFAGFFESDINIDIASNDVKTVDDLTNINMLIFSDVMSKALERSGVIIKGVSASAMTTVPDRNGLLFKTTLTLNILSQWRREIKIDNFISIINLCVDFTNNINSESIISSPNLNISTNINLIEQIQNM
jgi:hypothetical protein